jgi:hypothetical protein
MWLLVTSHYLPSPSVTFRKLPLCIRKVPSPYLLRILSVHPPCILRAGYGAGRANVGGVYGERMARVVLTVLSGKRVLWMFDFVIFNILYLAG